jgi:hypothetical protein
MPSPVGHVIAGVAAGWLVAGSPAWSSAWRREVGRDLLLFGALGALPDIDLLAGAHSGPTHSVGAAAIVAIAALFARGVVPGQSAIRFALACFAAYGSHVLLDWLATDSSPPIGIMALWPFRREHYESDLHLFLAISRRYWQGRRFVEQNVIAVLREIAILVPSVALVAWVRRRPTSAAGTTARCTAERAAPPRRETPRRR